MSAITEKVLSAEIVLLRHGGHCVEEQKEHLKVMIEKGVMHRIPKVVFTSLPSKFIYSSDAIKFRASIRNATDGHSIRNLINLFGGQGLKAWFGFEPHLCVEHSYRKDYQPRLWAGGRHSLNALSFGCIVGLDSFIPHFVVEENKFIASSVKFEHDMGRLQIKLLGVIDPLRPYLFNLRYSSIKSWVGVDGLEWIIYLNLNFPPIMESLNPSNGKRNSEERTRDYQEDDDEDVARDEEVLKAPHVSTRRTIDLPESGEGKDVISRCNVIRLNLAGAVSTQSSWRRAWKEVRNIQLKSKETIAVYFCGVRPKRKRYVLEPQRRFDQEVLATLKVKDFSMLYALRCAYEVSFKLADELDSSNKFSLFKDLLESMESQDVKAATRALFDLFYAIDSHEPVAVCDTLDAIFKKKIEDAPNLITYDSMCEVRRCIFTPTRMIFLPPILHSKSRFLRDYDPEYALWVHLRDDDLNVVAHSVRGDPKYLENFFRQYIKEGLQYGLKIGDRTYEFMGCSSSQLRDCGMFLYASDSRGHNAQSIRNEIGELEKIRSPAKYLARLGQAFSQPMGVYINPQLVRMVDIEPDIKGGCHPQSLNPYNFTDGCGRISPQVAEYLSSSLRREFARPPSAYQIRYAGCKGLLVIDPRLVGDAIKMRDSMQKFRGSSQCLDVIKPSAPTYAFLCKPLINILNQKGIGNHVFLKLQSEFLRKLTFAYTCHCKAVPVLKSTRLGLPFEKLASSGIDILGEVFFRKGLDTVVKRKIHDVKERARIELDHDKARVMFGVPDITNTLEEGEIFFQYSDEESPSKLPTGYEGIVLVTKFPCTHPGDVRKFRAKKFLHPIPGLTNLNDVIVFPVRGNRPHSNEMSGSDLDGDEYFITWDPSLIFTTNNDLAMVYPDTKAPSLNRAVEVSDMLEFYCKFVRDSGIGIISSAHLAISDRHSIYDELCNELARKSAIALDFAKTGESVVLKPAERPHIYPDFMDKEEKPMYQSSRALGYMHREIVDFRDFLSDIPDNESESDANVSLLTTPGWERHRESAVNAYNMYVSAIQHLQKMNGIQDEISLVYDCFVHGQKYLCGRNENDSVHEVCHRAVNDIMKKLRDEFYKDFSHIPPDQRTQTPECQAKASAWYLVTREMNRSRPLKFYLLPWIVSPVLSELAKARVGPNYQHHCAPCPSVNQSEQAGDMLIRSWKNLTGEMKRCKFQKEIIVWFDGLLRNGKFDDVDATDGQLNEARQWLSSMVLTVLPQVAIENVTYSEVFVLVMNQLYQLLDSNADKDPFYSSLRILILFNLFRFYRTRQTKKLWQVLAGDGKVYILKTFCLSMRNSRFRQMVTKTNSPLTSMLKQVAGRNEIEQMVAKIHEAGHESNDLCLVTVVGSKNGIWKLKNRVTNPKFYENAADAI